MSGSGGPPQRGGHQINQQIGILDSTSSSISQDEAFEHACRIWFEAPGRAKQELSELTTMEREKVWADLTGNREISTFELPVEDAATIQQCFDEFHMELMQYEENHDTSSPSALGYVLRTNIAYVGNPQTMIKYLRASDYSAKAAMALLCRHFDMKQNLFGNNCLARNILLSDLSNDDMEFLTSGFYQYLAQPDRAGRSISFLHFADPRYNMHERKKNVLRTMFYMNTTMSDHENVQRLGIVRVGYFNQHYPMGGPDKELIRMSLQMIETVPIRSVAFYLVSGSSLWTQTLDLMVLLCRPWLRVRTRIISGSYYENLYTLLCLGIPQNCIPAGEDGTNRNENLFAWIQKRRNIESGDEHD